MDSTQYDRENFIRGFRNGIIGVKLQNSISMENRMMCASKNVKLSTILSLFTQKYANFEMENQCKLLWISTISSAILCVTLKIAERYLK